MNVDLDVGIASAFLIGAANGLIALLLTRRVWQVWGIPWRNGEDQRWKLDWALTLFFWVISTESLLFTRDLLAGEYDDRLSSGDLFYAWAVVAVISVFVGYYALKEQLRTDRTPWDS